MPDINDMALQASLAQQGADMLPRSSQQTAVTNVGPSSTATQSVTAPVMPPEYAPAVAEMDAARARGAEIAQAQAAAQQRLGQVQTQEADANAWKAQQDELAAQQAQAERDRLQRQMAPVINGARAWSAQQQQRYASMKPGDYWKEKGFGAKVLAAIAAGLGALGAGLAKTPNFAQEILDRDVDAYNQRERQAIEQQGKLVELAQQGDVRAQQLLASQMADQASREAGRYAFIARQQATMLARAGRDKASIQNDIIVQQNLAKANAAEQEAIGRKIQALGKMVGSSTTSTAKQSGHSSTTRTTGVVEVANPAGGGSAAFRSEATGKGASDTERKADGFAERMYNQAKILNTSAPLSEQGRETLRNFAAKEKALEGLPKVVYLAKAAGLMRTLEQQLSPGDRKAVQAMREFSAANLRLESGAAISAGEISQNFDRFAPALGDSPEDVQRKQSAMADTALPVGNESYRPTYWRERFQGIRPKPTQPPAFTPGARVRNPQTGQTGVIGPDGNIIPDGG